MPHYLLRRLMTADGVRVRNERIAEGPSQLQYSED